MDNFWTSAGLSGNVWHMATKSKPRLTPREQRAYRSLGTIMRGLDISDSAVAARMGDVTRSTIQQRRTGWVKLRPEQIEEMADALGVPLELLDMEPPDIFRWLADNRSEQVFAASGWFSGSPEPALLAA